MLSDYGKAYNLGKVEVRDIFKHPVIVQEKMDGSQFSFMLSSREGLLCRTRNRELVCNRMDGTHDYGHFTPAVRYLSQMCHTIPMDVVFRGECMPKPKSNVLTYDRTPKGFIALFDAQYTTGCPGRYASQDQLRDMGREMELETVPSFQADRLTEAELDAIVCRPSFLGGPMEGLVFKSTVLPDPVAPGGMLKAKYLTPRFREVARRKDFPAWCQERLKRKQFNVDE